jgi:hypothetical protein
MEMMDVTNTHTAGEEKLQIMNNAIAHAQNTSELTINV